MKIKNLIHVAMLAYSFKKDGAEVNINGRTLSVKGDGYAHDIDIITCQEV